MKLLTCLVTLVGLALGQTSTPNIQPEPPAASYPIPTSSLALFTSYTPATYQSAFNVAPPAFDITQPPKSWFDSTQLCNPTLQVTYNAIQGASEVPFTIPACEASKINLVPATPPTFPAILQVVTDGVTYSSWPDVDVYLQQQVAQFETQALWNGQPTNTSPGLVAISPSALLPQVTSAAASVCASMSFNDKMFHGGVDPTCADTTTVVAKYSAILNTWAQAAQGIQTILGTVPGTTCAYCKAIATPAIPMPVRALGTDEILQPSFLSMMGNGPIVVAKASTVLAPPASSSGMFTAATQAEIDQILSILKGLTGTK